MPTPSPQQARNHYAERARLATAGGVAVAARVQAGAPWAQSLALMARYQLQAASLAINTMAGWADDRPASTDPVLFAGVSAYGYSIAEPLVATIDRYVPAPVEPLPAPWWDDAAEFVRQVEQLIESEIADAARAAAQVEMTAQPSFDTYVRLLVPPSCKRCVVLAGREYRDLDGFERHPLCDCIHVPASSLEEALDSGLVADGRQLVEDGNVRGLSAADTQAILDGADIAQVVNATAGTSQPGITSALETTVLGRRVKATTASTTRRAAWRRRNPSKQVRLRPESIYDAARDRDDALRLLKLYGYLT